MASIRDAIPSPEQPLKLQDEARDISSQDPTSTPLQESSKRLYASVPFSNPPKQIRVFDLETIPAASSSSSHLRAPIRGRLRVVDLHSETDFFALSYVWGNFSSPPATITCDGRQIEVTPNCLSALRHIAQMHGPVTIWVDALCIQQDNGREKHHQIALMGDIYAKAKSVLVWLGEGNRCIDKAMDFIATGGGLPRVADLPRSARDTTAAMVNSVSSCIRPTDDLEILTGPQLVEYYPRSLLLQHLLSPFRPDLNTGLKDFFTRPWIGRIWTLQEMVLARDARIICGTKSVPMLALAYTLDALELKKCFELYDLPPQIQSWRRLMELWKQRRQFKESTTQFEAHRLALRAATDTFTELRTHLEKCLAASVVFALLFFPLLWATRSWKVWLAFIPVTILIALVPFVVAAYVYYRCRYSRVRKTQRSTLGRTYSISLADSLLTELQERQSRFGRDRYFGIRSFLASSTDLDYNATPDNLVYQHMAQSIAESTRSLDILLLTSWDPRRHGPSWVPNWEEMPRWWTRLVKFHQFGQGRRLSAAAAAEEEESGDVQSSHGDQWSFIGADRLKVQGVDLGSISWTSSKIEPAKSTETVIERAFRLCVMLRDSHISDSFLKDFDSLVDRDATDIGRLAWLTRNMDRLDFHDVKSFAKSLPWWVDPRDGKRKTLSDWLRSIMRKKEEYRRSTPTLFMSMWPAEVARDLEHLFRYLQEQQMSLVRVMGYGAGYAPMGAEVGDLVALVAGTRLPVVLRPQPGESASVKIVGPVYIPAVRKDFDVRGIDRKEYILV